MMEQHAIPQQISSYEFKLVGEMTLKQFLKAAAGIVLAVIINSTGLVAIFKWPLMLLFAGAGLLLAFVPFEDRPLELWAISFLRSIYSPTIYTYKKKNEGNWLDLSKVKITEDEVKPEENLFVSAKKGGNSSYQIKVDVGDEGMSFKTGVKNTVEDREEAMPIIQNYTEDDNIQKIKSEEAVIELNNTEKTKEGQVDLDLKMEKLEATGQAVFGSIPMPDRPGIANVIVGMATTNEGKIIDGVIVEIQDSHGNPVRVIKTNALGQFKISTPLANGRYLIIAERDGYVFDRVNVDMEGKIIDPIRIIAHN